MVVIVCLEQLQVVRHFESQDAEKPPEFRCEESNTSHALKRHELFELMCCNVSGPTASFERRPSYANI